MGHRDRHRGLSHATGTHYGYEALLQQLRAQVGNRIVSAYHACQSARQPQGSLCRERVRSSGIRSRRARYRCDEAVAAPGHVRDIPCTVAPAAQRFAKPSDVRAKTTLLDHHVGPYARDQLLLGNNFSCTFDQRNQDVQRAAANLERHLVSEETPP